MYDKFSKELLEQVGVLLKCIVVINMFTLILSLLSFSIANKATYEKLRFYGKDNKCNCWETVAICFNVAYLSTTCLTIIFLTLIACIIF